LFYPLQTEKRKRRSAMHNQDEPHLSHALNEEPSVSPPPLKNFVNTSQEITANQSSTHLPRIFVSHSQADNAFCRQLVRDLVNFFGDPECVWCDMTGGLQAGDIWVEQVFHEIDSREIFLLVLSPAAVASFWVKDEILFAWKQKNAPGGKVIIPILYQLCDIPKYVQLVQILWFLPPRSYESALNDLIAAIVGPTERTDLTTSFPIGPSSGMEFLSVVDHFVGREKEQNWITERLRHGQTVAITALKGLAGIGKTALATVIVRRLQAEGFFAEGIAVVLCQNLTDPVDVLQQVLSQFDPYRRIPKSMDLTQLAALAYGLRGKNVLIYLDNIEPNWPVEQVLTPLRNANIPLLLTSRQQLPPELVPLETSHALDVLSLAEALDLFAFSTGQSAGSISLSLSERRAAERIIVALDLHTLAIKLAGTYAANEHRDLGALADELENQQQALDLLPRGEEPHAIRTIFALSVAALPRDAARLFYNLAAFSTPDFGRRAVLALGEALGFASTSNLVGLLISRSFLAAATNESMPEASDRERLRLHQLLATLAKEVWDLWTKEEQAPAQLGLARYYAPYCNQVLDSALESDERNITGSLEWAITHDLSSLFVELCHGMCQFWLTRGKTPVRISFLKSALIVAKHLAETGGIVEQRRSVRLNLAYGQALNYLGQPDEAKAVLLKGLQTSKIQQDRKGEGAVLAALGEIETFRGHFDEAQNYLQQALLARREVGDFRGQCWTLANLGWLSLMQGHIDKVQEYLQQSLTIAQELDDQSMKGTVLSYLGEAAMHQGHYEEAEQLLQKSLPLLRKGGQRSEEKTSLVWLGRIALEQGKFGQAEETLAHSLRIAQEISDRQGEGEICSQLGLLELLRGQLSKAEQDFQHSLNIRKEVSDQIGILMDLQMLGRVALVQHRWKEAEQFFQQSLEIIHQGTGYPRGEGILILRLAQIALEQGNVAQAEEGLKRSLQIAKDVKNPQGEAAALTNLGLIALARKQPQQAETLLHQSLAMQRVLVDRRGTILTLSGLAQAAELLNNPDVAEKRYQESLAVAAESPFEPESTDVLLLWGCFLAQVKHQTAEGCTLIDEASKRYATMGIVEAASKAMAMAEQWRRNSSNFVEKTKDE
jgi:tetratricopeptide (TPR) repeat protein